MTVQTYAPPIVRDGPLPTPPPFRLLDVAAPIGGAAGIDFHWKGGVALRPYPPMVPDGHDPCASGTFLTKADGDELPLPIFAPFTALIAETCTAAQIGEWRDYARYGNTVLAATESYALERQLAAGDPLGAFDAAPHQPYLSDENMTTPGGVAALSPGVALSWLENAIAATGRQGMIHADPATVAAWDWFGSDLHIIGGRLQTVRGTPIVVGDGYVGIDPRNAPGPAAGESWAFASGPVEWARSDQIEATPTTLAEALDRSDNSVTYRAERDMIVVWDTALQAGVLVNWTP